MRKIALVLACLACTGHGRRVKAPPEQARQPRAAFNPCSHAGRQRSVSTVQPSKRRLAEVRAQHGFGTTLDPIAKEFDVEFSEALSIKGSASGARGVFALADIHRGSLLASVPLSSCLTVPSESGEDAKLASAFLEALETEKWCNYAENILPGTSDAAFLWSDTELNELQFYEARDAADDIRQRFKEMLTDRDKEEDDNNDVDADEEDSDEEKADDEDLSLEELRWALSMIYTRSFDVDHLDGKPLRALAPFLDLFNHQPESPLEYAHQVRDWEADGFEEPPSPWRIVKGTKGEARAAIFANRDVKSGEEVRLPYGFETSAELVAAHGFMPTANSADYHPLFADNIEMATFAGEAFGLSEEQAVARLKIIEKLEAVDAPLAVRPGKLEASAHLLACMRLMAASDDELDGFEEGWVEAIGHNTLIAPSSLSSSSESAAMRFLADSAEAALAECPTTLEEDEQQLGELTEEGTTRLRLALQYRIQVKRMLQDFMKQCAEAGGAVRETTSEAAALS
mmetsp:Transcript_3341/g.5910  ORF Transcript_3341/g.5910 Transcript_3341/m.5910 type:complete len:513 (+) Transcript_3341:49-1587(+)